MTNWSNYNSQSLSRCFGKRMCETRKEAEIAMRVREESRAGGEEKSCCNARLCSDPALDGIFHPEFGRFPFLHNRHPSLLSLLSYLFCLLRHGRVTILRQRLNMAAPNSLQRMERSHYSPPWANTSIIGVAGSSGSGKTSLALAIIKQMSLPWVVILSMVRLSGP